MSSKLLFSMARPERFELPTPWFVVIKCNCKPATRRLLGLDLRDLTLVLGPPLLSSLTKEAMES